MCQHFGKYIFETKYKFNIRGEIKCISQQFGKDMIETKYTWQKFNIHGRN